MTINKGHYILTWCLVFAVDPQADVLVHSQVFGVGVKGVEHMLWGGHGITMVNFTHVCILESTAGADVSVDVSKLHNIKLLAIIANTHR